MCRYVVGWVTPYLAGTVEVVIVRVIHGARDIAIAALAEHGGFAGEALQ